MPPRSRKTTKAVEAPGPPFRMPVWPERACREPVAGEFANHSCEIVESHEGPHASQSVPQSVTHRQEWEKKNPDKLEPTAAADPFQ